jgi:hypothetical protein
MRRSRLEMAKLQCRACSGQLLKDPAQLDAWLRDGSAAYTDSLCAWVSQRYAGGPRNATGRHRVKE